MGKGDAQSEWNERLRDAFEASGMSVYRLAKETGLTISPLQRWLQGESTLTLSNAELVGRIVGADLVVKKRKGGRKRG